MGTTKDPFRPGTTSIPGKVSPVQLGQEHNFLSNTLKVHEHLQAAQKCQKDYFDQRIGKQQMEVGERVFFHPSINQ